MVRMQLLYTVYSGTGDFFSSRKKYSYNYFNKTGYYIMYILANMFKFTTDAGSY